MPYSGFWASRFFALAAKHTPRRLNAPPPGSQSPADAHPDLHRISLQYQRLPIRLRARDP
jgi:hypothetical protein